MVILRVPLEKHGDEEVRGCMLTISLRRSNTPLFAARMFFGM